MTTPDQPNTPDTAAAIAVLESMFESVDRRDWDRFETAFIDRVRLDYGKPEQVSPEQMRERWKPLFAGLDHTRHALGNFQVEISGDTAGVRSTFHAAHFLKGAPHGDTWILEGRYEHELVRRDGQWRIAAMKMIPGKSTGNAEIFADAKRHMNKLTPNLIVVSIEECLPFWVTQLGFEKTLEVPEGNQLGFVILQRGNVEVMLQSRASLAKDVPPLADDTHGSVLYIEVPDLAPIRQALGDWPLIIPERTTFYGAREIIVRDPAGNAVFFASRESTK
jgi:hypothetical protein